MFKYIIISLIFMQSTSAYMVPFINRRDAIIAASSVLLLPPQNAIKPVCVIGASGATGTECVKALVSENQHVRAVSRTPMKELDIPNRQLIEEINIDIKDKSKIDSIIKSTSAVIFLANAQKYQRYATSQISPQQSYEDIDVHALKNIATACIYHKVPRLVYVSASCRSCSAYPEEDIDKMSGITCDNCRSKQQGEEIIKTLYKNVPTATSIDYTIIHTGFIINTGSYQGEQRGVKEIELNQDFTKSGMISKYDLADICINAARSKNTARTTFEAYYRDSTQPYDIKESLNKCMAGGTSMEECFFGSAFRNTKPKDLEDIRNAPLKGSIFSTGFEHVGDTYADIFRKLVKDP